MLMASVAEETEPFDPRDEVFRIDGRAEIACRCPKACTKAPSSPGAAAVLHLRASVFLRVNIARKSDRS